MAAPIPATAPGALLDTAHAARFLGFAVQTLANWRVRGEGPAFLRIGRVVRYAPSDLQAWIDAHRFSSTTAADAAEHAA